MRCFSFSATLLAPVLLWSCIYNGDIPPTAKIDGAIGSLSSTDLRAAMLRFNEWISEAGPPQPIYRVHVVNANRVDIHYRLAVGPSYPEECRPVVRIKGKRRIGDICDTR